MHHVLSLRSCLTALVVSCAAAASLATPSLAIAPVHVTIAGSLQSEAGCPEDWDPACANTEMTYDAADGVWRLSLSLPAGDYDYKAAIDHAWSTNYGAHARLNGANIPLHLGSPGTVHFYFDDGTHWVTDDKGSIIAAAAGDFQSELGCPGDWQPDCLRSWLEDVNGDGVYGFRTSALPAGTYHLMVALREGWTVSYGMHGVLGGANITFRVPTNGAAMMLRFDAHNHRLSINRRWAWATVRDQSLSHTLAGRDRGSSTGSSVRVVHSGTGRYTVRFVDDGDAGGVVHVSALGDVPRVCIPSNWERSGADELASVRCYDRYGAPADSRFSISFQATASDPGTLAYLVADQPGATTTYTADSRWSANSSGGDNTVTRSATGRYQLTLGGLASSSGDVQVTAMRGGNSVPRVCAVSGWAPAGPDLEVDVRCRSLTTGVAADTLFSLSFVQRQGSKGQGMTSVAYLLADRPTTGSYTPTSGRRYAMPAGTPAIHRIAKGRWSVRLPSMPAGGAVVVTPYGAAARECQVAGITGATPQVVAVRCFDLTGAPADAAFLLAFER